MESWLEARKFACDLSESVEQRPVSSPHYAAHISQSTSALDRDALKWLVIVSHCRLHTRILRAIRVASGPLVLCPKNPLSSLVRPWNPVPDFCCLSFYNPPHPCTA